MSVTVRKRRGGADALIRSGALAAYGFREGHVPGSEVAGTVTSVADDVDTSWIGRRVCWCAEPPAASGSSAERGKRLRELGATHVLNRSGASDGPAPGSYDVVIGTVAGAHTPPFFDRLSPNGRRWNRPRWPTSSHSPHARPIRASRRPRTAALPFTWAFFQVAPILGLIRLVPAILAVVRPKQPESRFWLSERRQ
ncbi:alcohol dehydrogenase catalytic domain-containing protein [Streptomyces niveus]|uniref:alcohol dehydrogenase catalytic domain-containing protein n=1 Tax=Streptomyces niveus TaxID=193462 RepID=UPI0036815A2B